MDWNLGWLIAGGAAFLLVIINLIRSLMQKSGGWQILMFASLACGAIAILEEYRMVNTWVKHGDWSALEDVVPTMANYLIAALCIGLVLNLIVLLLHYKKKA